jgi:hypothetical protein
VAQTRYDRATSGGPLFHVGSKKLSKKELESGKRWKTFEPIMPDGNVWAETARVDTAFMAKRQYNWFD